MFLNPPDDPALDPRAYYASLLNECVEFATLKQYEPRVAFFLRAMPKRKQGRCILGTCYMPRVTGELSGMFDWLLEERLGYFPDFMIVLDAEWWAEASPTLREALVFHEGLHMGQEHDAFGCPKFHRETGEPVWAIRGHDIEEFNAVVARYGAWKSDVEAFINAVRKT